MSDTLEAARDEIVSAAIDWQDGDEDRIDEACERLFNAVAKYKALAGPTVNERMRALSKLGASKGGDARAQKLTPEQRHQIAKGAAETRWAAK